MTDNYLDFDVVFKSFFSKNNGVRVSRSHFTINLGPEVDEKLTSLARDRGTTKAEVLRRALISYATTQDTQAGKFLSPDVKKEIVTEALKPLSSSDPDAKQEIATSALKPTSRDVGYENPERQKLLTEYAEVNQNFRMLADIRFKLLALIPTLGGVAIFLLSSMQQSQPKLGYGLLFLISCLGFLATLGVTFYDQRNSQLYNTLIRRASNLETALELYSGQFLSRPERDRRMFWLIRLGHDSGLALIYGAVLGAWFYPLTSILLGSTGFVPERRYVISLVIAALMAALFTLELLRLDGTFKRIMDKSR